VARANQNEKKSLRPFERKLADVERLLGESRALLYDVTVLLVEIWQDAGYRRYLEAECGLEVADDATVADALDGWMHEHAPDFGFAFHDLRIALGEFPDRRQWHAPEGGIAGLVESAVARASAAPVESPPRTRRAVKLAEFEAVRQDLSVATHQLKHTQSELSELRRENKQLRGELERAQHRIQHLTVENDQLRAALARTESLVAT